jgi:hypothetical protein
MQTMNPRALIADRGLRLAAKLYLAIVEVAEQLVNRQVLS